MNDRRLESLVAMANEVRELDQIANSSSIVDSKLRVHVPRAPAARSHRRRVLRTSWIAGVCSLAAVLAVFAGVRMMLNIPGSSRTPDDNDLTRRDDTGANAVADSLPSDASSAAAQIGVVMAIVQDALGVVQCVAWEPRELRCCGASEAAAGDLFAASLNSPCVNSADRVVLVALAGPADSLPGNDAQAHAIATCLVGSANDCDRELGASTSTRPCLPAGVSATVSSLESSRR
jgi:hypothetical protein